MVRRVGVGLVVMVTMLLPWPARAESPRQRLESLLSDGERLPSRERLLAVSPDAERLLQQIALRSPRRLARNRAISLLRFFPHAKTESVLREVVRRSAAGGGGVDWLELQQALGSLAAVAGARSVDTIQTFLAYPSADLRRAAVTALGQVGGPRVLALLEARRRSEPSPTVRYRLEVELARLRAR